MGVSVSLLSVGTISFVGAVCFAAGYLFSAHSLRARPLNHADDDDDKENLKKSSIKGARRIFYIIHDMVRGKAGGKRKTEAMTVVDQKSKNKKHTLLEIESLAEIFEDFKMVLVVRNDLKMGKGKIAAQCSVKSLFHAHGSSLILIRGLPAMELIDRCQKKKAWVIHSINSGKTDKQQRDLSHATLGLYKKLNKRAPKALSRWEMCGQVKVVLRTESEEDLLVLQERAKSLKLPTHITIDAGRTQIAPNSRTVMAILGPADVVDDVSGGLKLL